MTNKISLQHQRQLSFKCRAGGVPFEEVFKGSCTGTTLPSGWRKQSVSLTCLLQAYAATQKGQEWPQMFGVQPSVFATQIPGTAHHRARVLQWVSHLQQNLLQPQTTQSAPKWPQPCCVWKEVRRCFITWYDVTLFHPLTSLCHTEWMFAGSNAHCVQWPVRVCRACGNTWESILVSDPSTALNVRGGSNASRYQTVCCSY